MAAQKGDKSNEIDVDLEEITVSAFGGKDKFSPKKYIKHKTGKQKSFLCYKNPAFDTSYDTFTTEASPSVSKRSEIGDPQSNNQISIAIDPEIDVPTDYDDEDDNLSDIDVLQESLPSSKMRRVKSIAKPGSLRQRNKIRQGVDNAFTMQEPCDQPDGAQIVPELEGLDASDSGRFKETTLPLHAKKSARKSLRQMQPRRVGKWKQFKFGMSLKWDRFKSDFKDFFKNLDIWKSNLKAVEGTFGTGVLSYFTFLRWLFLLNVAITILMFGFVIVPQLIYSPSSKTNNVTFTGLEFIDGEGWFKHTEMYYGTYHNETIVKLGSTRYNLPFAYLFVGAGYILICVVILVRSMALSYRENYISGKDFRNSFFTKVFCSWDYGVSQKNSATLQSKSIYNDIMESLSETRKKVEKSSCETCKLVMLRIVTNIIVLSLMAGASYLIYFVSSDVEIKKINSDLVRDMLPAVAISFLNLLLPFAFRIIASLEEYDSPKTTVEISLARTIVLKLASLCVYVVALYTDVKNIIAGKSTDKITCWETWVGESIYKLVIVDFIFVIMITFIGEFVRRVLAVYVPTCDKKIGLPGFDISRNVLDLIYSQGICWLGTFFCPMLPLINVIKFFIIFYFKKFSVLRNCRPSMRPFKASMMNLIFLVLLGLMLLLTIIVVGYVIMSGETLKPSATCGPFRGKANIYSMVTEVVNKDMGAVLRSIINVASSAAILTVIFFILGLLAYYFRLRKTSAEKKIKLLKEQITLAGQDKLYLLKEIRRVLKEQGTASSHIVS